MSTPDWGTIVQGDPGYGPSHAANKNSILNLLRQFGSTSALSPQEASLYGITSADEAGINENPFSTVANLAKTLIHNQYGITNNAAAHGAEFSGANAAAQAGEKINAGQRNFDAEQALRSGIGGVDSTDASQYGSAIQNLVNNYVPPPTPQPTTANPVPVQPPPSAAVNGLGTPYVNPGARENLVQPPKPPKLPTPVGIHAQ